jgi:hypothetical protein
MNSWRWIGIERPVVAFGKNRIVGVCHTFAKAGAGLWTPADQWAAAVLFG